MDSVEAAKQRIREIVAGSRVPEDPRHAENTLAWLRTLAPQADQALQIAALAHDIDRAVEAQKVRRADYDGDYDAFKAAHAQHGAQMLQAILDQCAVAKPIADEACRLVSLHEIGGDPRADLLKDADSISYFKVNLPLYYQREGWEETLRRSLWGYRRLSAAMQKIAQNITYDNPILTRLLREAIRRAH